MRKAIAAGVILALSGSAALFAQPLEGRDGRWGECCGMGPWPMGPGMMRSGPGSMARHHFAMMADVPAAYRSLSNPLPRTRETVERGARVYDSTCAACHGATGEGDGPEGLKLSPRPANLAVLSRMPMVDWDPFMYWAVAEGGAQFGTAMPAFKDALPKEDIWAVIAYIQARLPGTPK